GDPGGVTVQVQWDREEQCCDDRRHLGLSVVHGRCSSGDGSPSACCTLTPPPSGTSPSGNRFPATRSATSTARIATLTGSWVVLRRPVCQFGLALRHAGCQVGGAA